jgi:hypothetical protein
MKPCAYNCGRNISKITREHVIPDFIDKIHKEKGDKNLYFSASSGRYFKKPPRVKDVCQKCNSEELSRLDAYGTELYLEYFSNPIREKIIFKYNYENLFKWILKLSYNAARSFFSDKKSFKPYARYIIGRDKKPENIYLLGLTMKISKENGKDIIPRDIRASIVGFPEKYTGYIEVARSITLKSYMFMTIVFKKNINKSEIHSVLDFYCKTVGAKLISQKETEFTFDPDISKIDHVNYKHHQKIMQPKIYPNNGTAKVDGEKFIFTNYK